MYLRMNLPEQTEVRKIKKMGEKALENQIGFFLSPQIIVKTTGIEMDQEHL